jgi:hypothetical protein
VYTTLPAGKPVARCVRVARSQSRRATRRSKRGSKGERGKGLGRRKKGENKEGEGDEEDEDGEGAQASGRTDKAAMGDVRRCAFGQLPHIGRLIALHMAQPPGAAAEKIFANFGGAEDFHQSKKEEGRRKLRTFFLLPSSFKLL